MPELTCAAFDESERRLLVGWSQGSVQVYNFSNGTLLNNLQGDTTAGVTALAHAAYTKGKGDHRRLLLAAYDDGIVLQWPSKVPSRDCPPSRRMETPSWMGLDLADVPIMVPPRRSAPCRPAVPRPPWDHVWYATLVFFLSCGVCHGR